MQGMADTKRRNAMRVLIDEAQESNEQGELFATLSAEAKPREEDNFDDEDDFDDEVEDFDSDDEDDA